MRMKHEIMQTVKAVGDGTAVTAGLASWLGSIPLPEIVAVLTIIWLTISISGVIFKRVKIIYNWYQSRK